MTPKEKNQKNFNFFSKIHIFSTWIWILHILSFLLSYITQVLLLRESSGDPPFKVGSQKKIWPWSSSKPILLSKWEASKAIFSDLQLWQVKALQPLDLWWWIVAHLKAPSHICLHITEKQYRSTLKVCNLGQINTYLYTSEWSQSHNTITLCRGGRLLIVPRTYRWSYVMPWGMLQISSYLQTLFLLSFPRTP